MFFSLEYLFKFLIIGSASTGKSCILHQFLDNKCKKVISRKLNYHLILVKTDITHTIGAEFGSKVININQKNVKLQIWDVGF
jgi:Ras-related protein Rab-4B